MMSNIVFPDFKDRAPQVLADKVRLEANRYRKEIEQIRSVQDEPTFENTILALEQSGRGFDMATSVFFNLLSCDADDEMMALSQQLIPILTDISNEITLDQILATRVRKVYEGDQSSLSDIDKRLLLRTYEGYERRGAFLEEGKREELKRLRKELSMATLTFGQNVLKEQNAYSLQVTDEDALRRLPSSALETAKQKANEEGKEGWCFDFSMPSYSAVMKYCENRDIRERIYKDRGALCMDATKETCNKELVYKIATLRHQIASILGYDSYASHVLSSKMAKQPKIVLDMLNELREAYYPLAQKEIKEITAGVEDFKAWDWSYLSELYRQKHLKYDEEQTRPYFELSSVVRAMFDLACNLYELEITEDSDYLPYREDVKVYKVASYDKHLGLLLCDFHPRKGKRSGAWMTNYVEAYGNVRPVVSLVMNFTPATSKAPSLLTFDEVTTLFHEFGHGLHGLLTQVPYSSLSGTNVVHDFVELPSHFNENWARQPEFLKSFAKHYKTGEVIPDNLLEAIKRNALFLEGYSCIRQLGFGYLDMKWHGENPSNLPSDLEELEKYAREGVELFSHVKGTSISTSFSHIFSGGYAAGYYGYKWSEILEADAFEEFLKHGLTNHAISMRFRKEILEKGDAEDPKVLYMNFKGRAATIDALKRRSGLFKIN